jgi:hypothetical protein
MHNSNYFPTLDKSIPILSLLKHIELNLLHQFSKLSPPTPAVIKALKKVAKDRKQKR